MALHPSSDIEKRLKNIGKRLKVLRKAKGYSNYEQFAYLHDFNRSSVSRFESGNDIRMSSLLKMLDALEVSLQEFFAEGIEEEEE